MLSFLSSFKRKSVTISWKSRARWANKMNWPNFSAKSQIHCAFQSNESFSRISCAKKTRPLQIRCEKFAATRTKEKTSTAKNLWESHPQQTSNRAKLSLTKWSLRGWMDFYPRLWNVWTHVWNCLMRLFASKVKVMISPFTMLVKVIVRWQLGTPVVKKSKFVNLLRAIISVRSLWYTTASAQPLFTRWITTLSPWWRPLSTADLSKTTLNMRIASRNMLSKTTETIASNSWATWSNALNTSTSSLMISSSMSFWVWKSRHFRKSPWFSRSIKTLSQSTSLRKDR